MENNKTILLHNISPEEFKDMIVQEVKKEIEKILHQASKPEKLSVQEAAIYIGRSEITIYNYIKKGLLPASKIGRRYVINRSDIEASLKEVKSSKYRR